MQNTESLSRPYRFDPFSVSRRVMRFDEYDIYKEEIKNHETAFDAFLLRVLLGQEDESDVFPHFDPDTTQITKKSEAEIRQYIDSKFQDQKGEEYDSIIQTLVVFFAMTEDYAQFLIFVARLSFVLFSHFNEKGVNDWSILYYRFLVYMFTYEQCLFLFQNAKGKGWNISFFFEVLFYGFRYTEYAKPLFSILSDSALIEKYPFLKEFNFVVFPRGKDDDDDFKKVAFHKKKDEKKDEKFKLFDKYPGLYFDISRITFLREFSLRGEKENPLIIGNLQMYAVGVRDNIMDALLFLLSSSYIDTMNMLRYLYIDTSEDSMVSRFVRDAKKKYAEFSSTENKPRRVWTTRFLKKKVDEILEDFIEKNKIDEIDYLFPFMARFIQDKRRLRWQKDDFAEVFLGFISKMYASGTKKKKQEDKYFQLLERFRSYKKFRYQVIENLVPEKFGENNSDEKIKFLFEYGNLKIENTSDYLFEEVHDVWKLTKEKMDTRQYDYKNVLQSKEDEPSSTNNRKKQRSEKTNKMEEGDIPIANTIPASESMGNQDNDDDDDIQRQPLPSTIVSTSPNEQRQPDEQRRPDKLDDILKDRDIQDEQLPERHSLSKSMRFSAFQYLSQEVNYKFFGMKDMDLVLLERCQFFGLVEPEMIQNFGPYCASFYTIFYRFVYTYVQTIVRENVVLFIDRENGYDQALLKGAFETGIQALKILNIWWIMQLRDNGISEILFDDMSKNTYNFFAKIVLGKKHSILNVSSIQLFVLAQGLGKCKKEILSGEYKVKFKNIKRMFKKEIPEETKDVLRVYKKVFVDGGENNWYRIGILTLARKKETEFEDFLNKIKNISSEPLTRSIQNDSIFGGGDGGVLSALKTILKNLGALEKTTRDVIGKLQNQIAALKQNPNRTDEDDKKIENLELLVDHLKLSLESSKNNAKLQNELNRAKNEEFVKEVTNQLTALQAKLNEATTYINGVETSDAKRPRTEEPSGS